MGLIATSERDLHRIEILSKVITGRMTLVSDTDCNRTRGERGRRTVSSGEYLSSLKQAKREPSRHWRLSGMFPLAPRTEEPPCVINEAQHTTLSRHPQRQRHGSFFSLLFFGI